MMLPAAAIQPPTVAMFRPSAPNPALPGAVHGSKAMVNIQRYRKPIKLEFSVASSATALNPYSTQ
jgi:hypothetical protein